MLRRDGRTLHGGACEADDPRFGARSTTRDTASGLEWLDLTESAFYSYDQVVAQMGPGGRFEGWRYASMAEVATLFRHAGINDITAFPEPYQFYEANYDPVVALIALVGHTYPYGCGPGECLVAEGITATSPNPGDSFPPYQVVRGPDGNDVKLLLTASITTCGGCSFFPEALYSGSARLGDWIYSNDGSGWPGSWLVRQTAAIDIPEPGTLLLLGGGLLGLAGLRVARRHATRA